MKKFKRIIVAGAATTMLLASVLNVSAAGLKDIFDAKYYADNNADLKEAFGYNERQLYQHFITYGLKEGRNMSPILDVVAYREAYGDLDAAFGDNWDAYVDHFLTFGAGEMRDKGVLFNPVAYADAYGDIKAAFGDDLVAIAKHYLTFGKSENRTQGTSNGYADIATAKKAEQAAKQAEQAAQQAAKPDKPSVKWSEWGRTEYEYDDRGNCISTIYYDATGHKTWSYYSTYNSNDDVVYSECRDSEGNLQSYSRSVYDGKKIQKQTWYDGSGNVTSYATYEWNGNKVKVSNYDASGNLNGYSEGETDSHFNFTKEVFYDEEGKLSGSYAYTYDDDDNVLTYIYYGADGKERHNYTYTYYENGVQKTQVGIEGAYKSIYEFDENGSQVSGKQYRDGKLTNITTYEYYAEGPVAKRYGESYDSDGTIHYSEVVYDKQGKKLMYSAWGENSDGRKTYKYVNEFAADGSFTRYNYDSDGKLYRKEICDSASTIIAVYVYDADGTEVALVKNQYGVWVRPSEETNTDEPGGSVSDGDAGSGSVSGGDAA